MLKGRQKRFYLLLALELLAVLVAFTGCFRRVQTVCEIQGTEVAASAVPSDNGLRYQGIPVELRPGVYQVRVNSHPVEGQSLYVEVLCEDGGFKALQGNGVTIFPEQREIDFEVYVTRRISRAYVQCDIAGGGVELVDSISLYRTRLGGYMLLFLMLVGFAVLDGMILWRRAILDGKVRKEQQIVFWGLVGTVLLVYFPYLTEYFYGGADTFFHVTRIEALKESLLNGCPLPIRVQDYWVFGHGYAVSLFYGDFFLIIPALLRIIGFPLSFAYKAFMLLIVVATALIAYLSLKKCVKDSYAALFGAVLYTMVPYRVFDIYNRGAMGECLAMAFMPLVCCAVYLLFTENVDSADYKRYKWYLVIGMSALLQSHLISTELAACFMAAICVVFWKKTIRRQTFRELLTATLIVLLVNCWFWLPMLYMMRADTYNVSNIVSKSIQKRGAYLAGMFQLLPNKGGYQTGMFDCEPVQIGAAALLTIAVYFGFLLWKKKKMQGGEKCFLILTLLTLLLCLRMFPWDTIQKVPLIGQIVSTMQFPTRLMMLSPVFFAMFAAMVYRRLRAEGNRRFFRISVFLICMVCVCSCVYHVNDIAFTTEPIYLYTAENMGTVTLINGEYLLDAADSTDYYSHGPKAEAGLSWYSYEKRGTESSISLQNEAEEVKYLEIPLTGYQGYAIELVEGSGETPYLSDKRGDHGDLRIAVPGGFQGRVRIWYKGFAIFRVAEVVSGIGILLLGFGLYKGERKRVKGKE